MSLGASLGAVIAGFLVILTSVVLVAFRERRIAQDILPGDLAAGKSSDARLLVTIFLAIPGGMALMLVSAYLVFF